MNKTLITSIAIGVVCLCLGAIIGWHKGIRHGAHLTAKITQEEIQSHNTLLLLIEDSMNEPDEKKDDSVRTLLSTGLDQYRHHQDLMVEPFSVEPLHRDDVLIDEAKKRLDSRKILLRYAEE